MPKPILRNILVELESEEITAGGIHIPKSISERHEIGSDVGIVRQLGPEVYQHPDYNPQPGKVVVKVGDSVYFNRYSGFLISSKTGKNYRLINDNDIRAIAEPEDLEASQYVR